MDLAISWSFQPNVLAAPVPERRRIRQLPGLEGFAANRRTLSLLGLTPNNNLSCNSCTVFTPVVQATAIQPDGWYQRVPGDHDIKSAKRHTAGLLGCWLLLPHPNGN